MLKSRLWAIAGLMGLMTVIGGGSAGAVLGNDSKIAANYLLMDGHADKTNLSYRCFVRNWSLLGPFVYRGKDRDQARPELDARQALDTLFLPDETAVMPAADDAEMAGKKWQSFNAGEYLDLDELYGKLHHAVVYLAANLYCPQDVEGYRLLLGCDDYVKVWLNAKEIFSYKEKTTLKAERDQYAVDKIQLKKGWNVLVIKCVQTVFDWGIYCRLADDHGNPVKVSVPYQSETLLEEMPDLVSDGEIHDEQPSLTMDFKGNPWVVWVGYSPGEGDRIYYACQENGKWSQPLVVTERYGNYMYPRIAALGETMYVFWTATTEVPTSIWMSSRIKGKWSEPMRISPPQGYHLNAAVCGDPAGKKIWLAWQGCTDKNYDIFLAAFDGQTWSDAVILGDHPGNDWDPALACDSSGRLWIAWSGFHEMDYDIYLASFSHGKLSEIKRLTDHQAYDLHPSITVDKQDRIWLSWDRIDIGMQGNSGGTGIPGTSPRIFSGGSAGTRDNHAAIEIRCLADRKEYRLASPFPRIWRGYTLQPCSYPKIAFDDKGVLWLLHRALHGNVDPDGGYTLPRNIHNYDLILHRYDGKQWDGPTLLEKTSGYLDRPAICAAQDKVWLANEVECYIAKSYLPGRREWEHKLVIDYLRRCGEISVKPFAAAVNSVAFELQEAPVPSAKPSPLSRNFIPRERAQYGIESHGEKYNLYFGETHRHTDVSMCGWGTEPTHDDIYMYGHDVDRYDFFMTADHGNSISDFWWWKNGKLADLFYIPGSFVTLFGYEWSGVFPAGHHNVVFFQRCPAGNCFEYGYTNSKLTELWKFLAGLGIPAITIPHTTGGVMGTDWRDYNPRFERLVEVFQSCSGRGSCEHAGCPRGGESRKGGFVWDALAKGYRLGLICSSDHTLSTAYAAVYAKAKTREDIFEALYQRRCYGASAYGIILDFRADGRLMGEEYPSNRPAQLSIGVKAYTEIAGIEIIGNSQVRHAWGSVEKQLGQKEYQAEWTEDKYEAGTHYYYVRVILKDGEMAWSSPVWITSK